MKWQDHKTYEEVEFFGGTITLEKRPDYCDRGNFLAKLFPNTESLVLGVFDNHDGWPRYYMDKARAKAEIADWIYKRTGQHENTRANR